MYLSITIVIGSVVFCASSEYAFAADLMHQLRQNMLMGSVNVLFAAAAICQKMVKESEAHGGSRPHAD
jgi:hypothetical protein